MDSLTILTLILTSQVLMWWIALTFFYRQMRAVVPASQFKTHFVATIFVKKVRSIYVHMVVWEKSL